MEWRPLMDFVVATSSFCKEIFLDTNKKERLLWLQYVVHRLTDNPDGAIGCLNALKDSLEDKDTIVHLNHQTHYNTIQKDVIDKMVSHLQLGWKLNNVVQMYQNQEFSQLIDILKSSLSNGIELENMALTSQLEILLDCLWQEDDYRSIFMWAERYVDLSVEQLFKTRKPHTRIRNKWMECIRYGLAYIHQLLRHDEHEEEKYSKYKMSLTTCHRTNRIPKFLALSLDKCEVRLIKNIVSLIVLTQEEMNAVLTSVSSLQNILHQLLLGAKANMTDAPVDNMRSCVEIFDRTHTHLAESGNCCANNGALLLEAFDFGMVVLQKSGSARHVGLNDFLKDTAHCLFGMPSAHGKSHNCTTHVEMTWERTLQLCNVYMPIDKLMLNE